MSDVEAEINYHIARSGTSDRVTLDVGVLEHWRKEYAALKRDREALAMLRAEIVKVVSFYPSMHPRIKEALLAISSMQDKIFTATADATPAQDES